MSRKRLVSALRTPAIVLRGRASRGKAHIQVIRTLLRCRSGRASVSCIGGRRGLPSMLLKSIRALLVASVLVPAAVFGLFAWHSHNQIIHSAQDRAQRFATVVQEHTLKVFETILLVLQAAEQKLQGVSTETLAGSKELWDQLRKLEESSEQVGSIFVVDRHGFGWRTQRR